jgi:hypothetical protein
VYVALSILVEVGARQLSLELVTGHARRSLAWRERNALCLEPALLADVLGGRNPRFVDPHDMYGLLSAPFFAGAM